jgi:membrane protease YdiL (CAAX protease family)
MFVYNSFFILSYILTFLFTIYEMKVLTMVLKEYVLRRNLKLICAAYLLFIACAELLIIYNTKIGIAVHLIILFVLPLHSTLESDKDKNFSRFLTALVLVPLIRILSLSMPLAHFSRISWFLLISIPIFSAIFTCMWVQELRPKDVGLFIPALKSIPIEAGVILFAIPLGIIEYQILKPVPLPIGAGVLSLITFSLIFIICTGFVEELVFRGVIQYNAVRLTELRASYRVAVHAKIVEIGRLGAYTRLYKRAEARHDIVAMRCYSTKIARQREIIARKARRKWGGIIFVTSIFAVLHISNLSPLDCLLAFSVGFLYSVVREKTGSIYGISISHGILNILLFLVAPLYF